MTLRSGQFSDMLMVAAWYGFKPSGKEWLAVMRDWVPWESSSWWWQHGPLYRRSLLGDDAGLFALALGYGLDHQLQFDPTTTVLNCDGKPFTDTVIHTDVTMDQVREVKRLAERGFLTWQVDQVGSRFTIIFDE